MVRWFVIFASFKNGMSYTEGLSEKGIKGQLIIEAAQRRFGQFGIEKTSMREIADDLNLSKASIYYYFPDKESLYVAVVEKEQNEFIERISHRILTIEEPGLLLREYAISRQSYFRTLLNLSQLRIKDFSDLKPVFRETIILFKEREKEIIIRIFEKGIKDGVFVIEDTDKTASLFLDLLRGLRVSVVNEKKMMFIDQQEYDMLLERTVSFTDIFLKGLRK